MNKYLTIILMFTYQLVNTVNADTLLIEKVNKISSITIPTRGMTMQQVLVNYGEPTEKGLAIGNPPITKWKYEKFTVYFEEKWVIQAVILKSKSEL